MTVAVENHQASSNNKKGEEQMSRKQKKKPGWGSVLRRFQKKLRFLSPVKCLARTRDSYVRGMNNLAASGHYGSMMAQGPHLGALSRNPSRSVSAEEDLYQLIRAASVKKGLDPAFPRSVSVQEHRSQPHQQQHGQQPGGKLGPYDAQRSFSHSGISRFQVQKTILEEE